MLYLPILPLLICKALSLMSITLGSDLPKKMEAMMLFFQSVETT